MCIEIRIELVGAAGEGVSEFQKFGLGLYKEFK